MKKLLTFIVFTGVFIIGIPWAIVLLMKSSGENILTEFVEPFFEKLLRS
jgi:hypothetical protein